MTAGVTGVDQEIAVHFRHLRAADAQASAAGRIDELPGAISRPILEGRAAGLFADRLRGIAVDLHLVPPCANGIGRSDPSTIPLTGKNDGSVSTAVTIG